MMRRGLVILLALLLDILSGDPPNRYHPTAWMGTAIAKASSRAPRRGQVEPLIYGAGLALAGAGLVATIGRLVSAIFSRLPAPLGVLAEAAVLKSTFSWRGLRAAAHQIEAALGQDLPEARRLLSWHLVSRPTDDLTVSQVAGATVESVAENTCDSLVAPLLYYAAAGLPAALAYRFLNTADAMLGYHDEEHEWLGKVPARLDDLANLLPSRLSAALIVGAAHLCGEDGGRALRVWQRDAGQTASPNAGHPMSAMAGALGVELEKVGHYRLGGGQRAAQAEDIRRSVRVMDTAVVLGGGALIAGAVLAGFLGRKRP